jgi:ABC-type sugar transport system ATPase subunit
MLLNAKGLTKRFPGVIALEGVDFAADSGEVHALVGANGAGKSTLMNLLSGVFKPTAGEILIDDAPVKFDVPRDAVDCGISTVYQEFSSIPQLTVAQNIFLGREPANRIGLLDIAALKADARAVLERYHLELDETALVEDLSIAKQQLVEIARALSVQARILILDEPTAVLSLHEQENLFNIIDNLKNQGMLILYVSHRMEEIFSISDRVTVLRDGGHIATLNTAETNHASIVHMMIGHEVVQSVGLAPIEEENEILEVDLGVGQRGFRIHHGEVLGITGLVGAGRTETAHQLIGLGVDDGVSIIIDGHKIVPKSPEQALRNGIVYLTEDRKRDGLFSNLSILNNVTAAALNRFSTLGFLRPSNERRDGGSILERLHLVSGSLNAPVRELSGGNQQKVVFGRALLCNPRVLICDEPTRGVDVGAKEEIYRLLVELAGQGVAVIFISSELKELLSTTHRLLVMHEGKVVADMPTDEATEEKVLLAATGMAV